MKILRKALIGILLGFHLIGNSQWSFQGNTYTYKCFECPVELKVMIIDSTITINYSNIPIKKIEIAYLNYASQIIHNESFTNLYMKQDVKNLKTFISKGYGWLLMNIYYYDNTCITYIVPTKASYREYEKL